MSPREPEPGHHRNAEQLDGEDVIALIGYVGVGVGGNVRLCADLSFQRWLDLPQGAVRDSVPLNAADPAAGRTVVWVTRQSMKDPIFDDSVDLVPVLEGAFADAGMSVWPLLPDSRYVAAELLGLLAQEEEAYT